MIEIIAQNMAPIMFVALVLFLLLGYPVAFALAANGLLFFVIGVELAPLSGGSINLSWPLLGALPDRFFGGVVANETLLAIPFFTFMGIVLEKSGMAEDLLDTIGQLFGPIRGGLAYAVIFVGALLAARQMVEAGESGSVVTILCDGGERYATSYYDDAWLAAQGRETVPYHAGLDAQTREANQDRFIKGEGVIVVATVAFGMGIDKPNVRFVAHLDLPKSLEAYYQETGRAGRDGLPADAWMAYGLQDVIFLKQMLNNSEGDERHKRVEQHKLDAMLALCEETRCRRQALLAYFDEELPRPCGHCDNCVDGVQTWDATEPARQALSAIYRSGQRYGVGHLVDVLLGRDNDKVRGLGHQHLSVFGVGKALSEGEWRSLFRQLVARGLADVDLEGFGGLRLSDSCRPLLRGEVTLELRRDLSSKAPKPASSAASQLVRSEERETWEALRTLRRKLAEEHSVPPYVIFPDATLLEMLRSQPASLADMARISGVGARKLERYGQAFLEVLQGTVEVVRSPADLRHELVTLARAGMTPAQIARQLDCSEKNVYTLLAEAIGKQQLSLEQALDLPEDLLGEIQEAFLDGEGELPPVGDVAPLFAGRVPEQVLYCVRAALQAEFEL